MRQSLILLFAVFCCSLFASPQTADELISKNIQAKGGTDAIKAIKTVRMAGRLDAAGGFTGKVGQENMRPNLVRETFSLQGMTAVQDPQLMGDDDVRDLLIDSDFDGPLVDYKAKGNTVEYLGHDTIDGDDVLRLKVTLKNGDIVYYYLDPDTFLEIRTERQEFVRGSVRESVTDLGSYKKVGGLMYPFSVASGPKNDPSSWQSVTMEKIEVNVPLSSSEFAVPASLSKEAPKKQEAAKQ